MYLKPILFFVIYYCSELLMGQHTTFELLLDSQQEQVGTDIFEDERGNFYCVGFSSEPKSDYRKGFILKIDPFGKLIDSVTYMLPDQACTIYSILQDTPGVFILSSYLSDTTSSHYHTKIKLQRVDYELNIIKESTMHVSDDHQMLVVSTTLGINNDILITGGIIKDLPPYTMYLNARFNNDLDSVHASVKNLATGGLSIKQLNDTSYWLMDWSYHYFLCDTLFNITDYYDVPEHVDNPVGVKWDSDTSFFFAGEWNGGPDDDIGIIRQYHPFDQTGYLFNSWGTMDTLDITALNGALDFRCKDSVFVGGTTGFVWPEEGYHPSYYSLIQTDSLLNIRWERFYGSDEHYYVLHDVLATRDGGCLLTGTRFDYDAGADDRDIYILKLNNEGLILGEHNYNKPTLKEAIVYPNPGTNQIKVRIAAQYPQCIFELYDVNGNKVISQEIIGKWGETNTSFLSPGSYVYQIHNNEGLFETGKWVKH